jgi:hypothetical protein
MARHELTHTSERAGSASVDAVSPHRCPLLAAIARSPAQAATTNGGVLISLSIVVVVYGVIGAVTIARRAYSAGLTGSAGRKPRPSERPARKLR